MAKKKKISHDVVRARSHFLPSRRTCFCSPSYFACCSSIETRPKPPLTLPLPLYPSTAGNNSISSQSSQNASKDSSFTSARSRLFLSRSMASHAKPSRSLRRFQLRPDQLRGTCSDMDLKDHKDGVCDNCYSCDKDD